MTMTMLVLGIVTVGHHRKRLMGSNSERLDGVGQAKVGMEAMTNDPTAVEPRLLGDPLRHLSGLHRRRPDPDDAKAALSTMRPPTGNETTRYGPARSRTGLSAGNYRRPTNFPEPHLPTQAYSYCTVGVATCDAKVRTPARDLNPGQIFTYYDSSSNRAAAAVGELHRAPGVGRQHRHRPHHPSVTRRRGIDHRQPGQSVNAGSEPTPSASRGENDE